MSLANPVAKGISAKAPDQLIAALSCGAVGALRVADLGASGASDIDQDDAPSIAGAVALGATALLTRGSKGCSADGNAVRGVVIGDDTVHPVWAVVAKRCASLGGLACFGVSVAIIAFVAEIGGDELISGVAALAAVGLGGGRADRFFTDHAIGSDLAREIGIAALAEASRG